MDNGKTMSRQKYPLIREGVTVKVTFLRNLKRGRC